MPSELEEILNYDEAGFHEAVKEVVSLEHFPNLATEAQLRRYFYTARWKYHYEYSRLRQFYGDWALPVATRLKHWGEEPSKKAKKNDFSEIVEDVILFPGKATFAAGEFLQKTTGSSLMGIAGLSLATIGFCTFLAPLGAYGPAVCCASVTAFAVKEGVEKRSQEQHLKENINKFVGKLPFTDKVNLQMATDIRQHIEYPTGISELLYGVYKHFQQYMAIK